MIPINSAAADRMEPRIRRTAGRTPISDCIRARLHARTEIDAGLCPHTTSAERQGADRSSAIAAPSLASKDIDILPPFQNSELDDPQLLASAAIEIYRMRRARDRFMPSGLMGEPAWDILLALFFEEPDTLTVSSLCYGSGVPQTTALRWVSVLVSQGLVERTKHHRDGRIVLVSLSDKGRVIMERCLKAMLRSAHG